jgi:hypothetical protein
MSVQGFGPFRRNFKSGAFAPSVIHSPDVSVNDKGMCDSNVEINKLKSKCESLKLTISNLNFEVSCLKDTLDISTSKVEVLEADLDIERKRVDAEIKNQKSAYEAIIDNILHKHKAEIERFKCNENLLKRNIEVLNSNVIKTDGRVPVNIFQYDDGGIELDVDSVDNATFDIINFESLKSVVKHMHNTGFKVMSPDSSNSTSSDSGVCEVYNEFDDIDCINVFSGIIDNIQHVNRLAGYMHRIRVARNVADNDAIYNGMCAYIFNWKLFPKRDRKMINVIASDMCSIGYKRLLNYYCYTRKYNNMDILEAMNISVDINDDMIDLSDMTNQIKIVNDVDLLLEIESPVNRVYKAKSVDSYYNKHIINDRGIGLLHQMSHMNLKNTEMGWYHMGKSNVINESSMICYVDDEGITSKTRPIRRSTDDPSYVLMKRMSYIRDKVVCVDVSGGRLPIIAQLIRDEVVDDLEYHVGEQVKSAMNNYSIHDFGVVSNSYGGISIIVHGVEDKCSHVPSNFNCCSVANRTKVRH